MSSAPQGKRKIKYGVSTYDRDFFLKKRFKWPQSRKLKIATVLDLFLQRQSFQNIKRVALDRLEKTIYDQLDVLRLADPFDYTEMQNVSQGVFSWRKKKFLKRRRIKKTIWVDVLKMIASKDLLVRFKIRTDLKEIKALIETFFDGIRNLNEIDMAEFDAKVNDPMREMKRFVDILPVLEEENIVLLKNYRDAKRVVNTRLYRKQSARQEALLHQKEEAVVNAKAWFPIELRYQLSWYTTGVSMLEVKKALAETSLTKCIRQKQFATEMETARGASLNDICHDLSESFKYQIQHFQARYDAEVEDIDNDMNYTHLQIKKLEEHRKFLNKEIERFHKEIKECLDREAAERQAKIDEENERLRLEQEAKLEQERKDKAKAKREKQKQKQQQKAKFK